jgi:FlaA1/EpsC-like NDP-sugar epimerase
VESSVKAIFEYFLAILKVLLLSLKSIFDIFFKKEINVENEIVLITGAGSGIGKELALQYGNLGSKVVCWDINEENNKETVKLIKSKGQEAFGFT